LSGILRDFLITEVEDGLATQDEIGQGVGGYTEENGPKDGSHDSIFAEGHEDGPAELACGFGVIEQGGEAVGLFEIPQADLSQGECGAAAQIQWGVRFEDEVQQTTGGFGGQQTGASKFFQGGLALVLGWFNGFDRVGWLGQGGLGFLAPDGCHREQQGESKEHSERSRAFGGRFRDTP
jgi:hypothetical protein